MIDEGRREGRKEGEREREKERKRERSGLKCDKMFRNVVRENIGSLLQM